ncbi:MAG: hypothetical protein Q8K24_05940 [Hydrogenophaga sp.]|nr:hypothetical protein [Hydrogenophaga sp.]
MSTRRPEHKRGDTFSHAGEITVADAGTPVLDLTGWQGRSQVRSQLNDALIADLEFTWLDATQRLCALRCQDTSTWPLGEAEIDIQLTSPDGDVVSTGTTVFAVVKDVTRHA